MITGHVVSRVIDGLLDKENKICELYVILLANVTCDVRGTNKILQKGDSLQGYYVTKLIELFHEDSKAKDHYSWIGSILNNVTQIEEGRKLIMDRTRNMFVSLLSYIQHHNKVRQRGVLGMIRNCLFDSCYHPWALGDEVDILSKLLMPLRGPEKYDDEDAIRLPVSLRNVSSEKKREEDLESRSMIVDTLLLLASTTLGRELMRKKNIYIIIRDYDNIEENETINENLYSLVILLKGLDEPSENVAINPSYIVGQSPEEIKIATNKQTENQKTPEKIELISTTNSTDHQIKTKKDVDETGEEIEEI